MRKEQLGTYIIIRECEGNLNNERGNEAMMRKIELKSTMSLMKIKEGVGRTKL